MLASQDSGEISFLFIDVGLDHMTVSKPITIRKECDTLYSKGDRMTNK